MFSVVFTGLEPVIPPYLQSTWGLSVTQVGLVYIAAVVPNFVGKSYVPSILLTSEEVKQLRQLLACFLTKRGQSW